MLCSTKKALRGARKAASLLFKPRNENGESPPNDPLQLVSVRRNVHRGQQVEAKIVRA